MGLSTCGCLNLPKLFTHAPGMRDLSAQNRSPGSLNRALIAFLGEVTIGDLERPCSDGAVLK